MDDYREIIASSSAKKKSLVSIKDPIENLRPASKSVNNRELQTDRHLEETSEQ